MPIAAEEKDVVNVNNQIPAICNHNQEAGIVLSPHKPEGNQTSCAVL
jgi:hypothetical protein